MIIDLMLIDFLLVVRLIWSYMSVYLVMINIDITSTRRTHPRTTSDRLPRQPPGGVFTYWLKVSSDDSVLHDPGEGLKHRHVHRFVLAGALNAGKSAFV
jgi:hypothetical protein